uniref:Uncharacterized protein n=1 Tax=Glossina brevipalpis TaxID=37001 RepID=A0A1A9WXW2_9MUSC
MKSNRFRKKRQIHLAELMSHICLPLLSNEFLKNGIVTEPLFRGNPKCHQFLIDVYTYQSILFHVYLIGDRATDNYLFPADNRCKVYDVSTKKLMSIQSMNVHRSGNSAVVLNRIIYSVGGYDCYPSKAVERYVPVIKEWNYIAPMKDARHGCGICAYNGLILCSWWNKQ